MASIVRVVPSESIESRGVKSVYNTSHPSLCSDRLRVPRDAHTSLDINNTSSKIKSGQATTSPEQDIIAEEKVEQLLRLVNVQDTTSLESYSAAKVYRASKYLNFPKDGSMLNGMDPRKLFHSKKTLMEVGAEGMTLATFPTLETNVYYDKELHETAILITGIKEVIMHELIFKVSGAIEMCYELESMVKDEGDILWPLKFVGRAHHIDVMIKCDKMKEDLRSKLSGMMISAPQTL